MVADVPKEQRWCVNQVERGSFVLMLTTTVIKKMTIQTNNMARPGLLEDGKALPSCLNLLGAVVVQRKDTNTALDSRNI